MRMLDVFFDYACPYCYRAHALLKAILPAFTDVSPIWHPCEAHPRPESYGPHSDLCIRGFFYAQAQGVDAWAYHDRVFDALYTRRVNIESADALAAAMAGMLDTDAFRRALIGGAYAAELANSNDLAYARCGVWVVPAYRLDGRPLDAAEDIGVTKDQLLRLLTEQ